MKRSILILLTAQLMLLIPDKVFPQSTPTMQEFGITTGTFSNFPANQNYFKDAITVFYAAPYVRVGKHEFSAGVVYPLSTEGLNFSDYNVKPRLGATAGYKFYIFNVYGVENLFIHYSFQYLRFKGHYDVYDKSNNQIFPWDETDMYINNVIGLGYNVFFDVHGRFGFYYILDYVIAQTSYKLDTPGVNSGPWSTQYIWNNLSTNIGFIFKITSLKKNPEKPKE
jgi:hypothetical protein